MGLEEIDEPPVHVSKPVNSLVEATQRLRERNDKLDEALRKERGSLPPSAPRIPAAPSAITVDRAKEIARALRNNHTMLTLVALLDVEPRITPAEFQAWCALAIKGAK